MLAASRRLSCCRWPLLSAVAARQACGCRQHGGVRVQDWMQLRERAVNVDERDGLIARRSNCHVLKAGPDLTISNRYAACIRALPWKSQSSSLFSSWPSFWSSSSWPRRESQRSRQCSAACLHRSPVPLPISVAARSKPSCGRNRQPQSVGIMRTNPGKHRRAKFQVHPRAFKSKRRSADVFFNRRSAVAFAKSSRKTRLLPLGIVFRVLLVRLAALGSLGARAVFLA
eukprot:SAG11_NODE_1247_length_5401_cov_2.372878_6_plen_228_part_00